MTVNITGYKNFLEKKSANYSTKKTCVRNKWQCYQHASSRLARCYISRYRQLAWILIARWTVLAEVASQVRHILAHTYNETVISIPLIFQFSCNKPSSWWCLQWVHNEHNLRGNYVKIHYQVMVLLGIFNVFLSNLRTLRSQIGMLILQYWNIFVCLYVKFSL